MEEHAVIVQFNYTADSIEPLHDLEDELEAAIADAGVGEFDGNEMAVDLSHGSFYMYGPDADSLFAVVQPLLAGSGLFRKARVTLRYGPPEDGVRERVVWLDSASETSSRNGDPE